MNDQQHGKTWEETVEPEQAKRKNWAGFVENEAVTFFEKFDLEKLTLEDGLGSAAVCLVVGAGLEQSSPSKTAWATRPNCSARRTTASRSSTPPP